jgi:serine/threonine protein kinase
VKGLEVLHDLKIIHRDLKVKFLAISLYSWTDQLQSDNIFVCMNPSGIESLAIGDFDTAKCVIEGVARTTIGTPGYMARKFILFI